VSPVDPIQPAVSPSDRMPLLTQGEVGEVLRVTRRTIRRWDAKGILRPIRVGGVTRYRADEITALIDPSNDASPPGLASPVTTADAARSRDNAAGS
jgi:excisionase family DNA binding protein